MSGEEIVIEFNVVQIKVEKGAKMEWMRWKIETSDL